MTATRLKFYSDHASFIQRSDVLAYLKAAGIDEKLLGEQARIYLVGLLDAGGRSRLEVLAGRLRRRARWMKETERLLLQRDLITILKDVRHLTDGEREEALRIRAELDATAGEEDRDETAPEVPRRPEEA